MTEKSTTATKTFSILCIGQRGVGKTVFLAGSYAELHSSDQLDKSQSLWFDCQESKDQENLNSILSYITKTGQYPPPTMKITNFNFSVKYKNWMGAQTLCNFRWWDIPGEFCNFDNSDFRSMVFNSHSCCIFIDAPALLYQPYYGKELESIIEQVTPLATLTYLNGLDYSFAVILTKCDLLKSDLNNKKNLDEKLQPLINLLQTVNAKYKTFYSYIPIVGTKGVSILKAKGSVDSLLWLVQEIKKSNNSGVKGLFPFTNGTSQPTDSESGIVKGALQNLIDSEAEVVTTAKTTKSRPSPFTRKRTVVITLSMLIFMMLAGAFLIKGAMLDSEGSRDANPNFINRN